MEWPAQHSSSQGAEPFRLPVGVTVDQILGINPDVKPGKVVEGQTILLPAQKLSDRDREILGGIGTTYRVYPIRAGETLSEVLSKRGISTDEFLRLNPGVDMKAVKGEAIGAEIEGP